MERFVAAMNRHDVDGLQGCYTPDAFIVYPGREAQTPEAYAAGERAILESVPDYHIEATSILEAGEHVVVELRMHGTQRPDLGGR